MTLTAPVSRPSLAADEATPPIATASGTQVVVRPEVFTLEDGRPAIATDDAIWAVVREEGRTLLEWVCWT